MIPGGGAGVNRDPRRRCRSELRPALGWGSGVPDGGEGWLQAPQDPLTGEVGGVTPRTRGSSSAPGGAVLGLPSVKRQCMSKTDLYRRT